MDAPPLIVDSLKAYDPDLFVSWDSRLCRWKLLRHNRFKPSQPPDLVKVWSAEGGGFLPLDRRLLVWVQAADLRVRFHTADAKRIARLLEAEMDREQAELDAAKAKALTEDRAAQIEELTYCFARDINEPVSVGEAARSAREAAERHVKPNSRGIGWDDAHVSVPASAS